MKNYIISLTIVLIGTLIFSSCKNQKSVVKDVPADKIEKVYTITKKDILTVEILSNPTTGYSWHLSNKIKPNVIEEFSKEFIKKENKDMVGAGGYDVFKFVPQKAGEVFLYFKYQREDGKTEKEKYFKVIVTE